MVRNLNATAQFFSGRMEAFNREIYEFAAQRLNLAPYQNFLDIGFGNGALLALLAPKISKGLLAGIEPSKLMVDAAKDRLKAQSLDLRLGTVSQLPWPDETFHKAAAIHSFHFWAKPDTNLNEVYRVLRPGALLLLVLRHEVTEDLQSTVSALERSGFTHITDEGPVSGSTVIIALRPS